MLIKSGKTHQKTQLRIRPPLDESIIREERFAETFMRGSLIQKLGAIIDIVKSLDDGKMDRISARRLLAGALEDESKQVRWSSVYALGQINALPELSKGLENDCDEVRGMSAAMIYASLRNSKRINTLLPPDGMTEGLIYALIRNLSDAEGSVAVYSTSALSEIANRYPIQVMAAVSGMREVALPADIMLRLILIEQTARQALEDMAARNRA